MIQIMAAKIISQPQFYKTRQAVRYFSLAYLIVTYSHNVIKIYYLEYDMLTFLSFDAIFCNFLKGN